MFKLERILHFAAAIVTQLIHMSAALAYSPLLSLAAQHHQSIRLHRGLTENDGPSKLQDMKLQDMKRRTK